MALLCCPAAGGGPTKTVDLPTDCAEAAFALAHHVEHREEKQQPAVAVEDSDSDEETLKFGWEETEQPLPRELQELWQRAATGTQRIEVKKLLETHPRLQGIPSRAQENQLCPEHRKKADQFLRTVSQQLLNAVRLMTYRWVAGPDPQLQLQIFQHLAEMHFKLVQERRELSVQGISRLQHHQEGLFSEKHVKAQRMEASSQKISMFSKQKNSRGGSSAGSSGLQSFLHPMPLSESSGNYSGNFQKSTWRGKPAFCGAKGGKGFKGSWNSSSTSWKGSFERIRKRIQRCV